jgi:phosphoribosyl 1,2-cyclic phosphodiesterase
MPSDHQLENPEGVLVRFWGVRGSIPTPGPSTVRYGGNTTCVELRINGEIIVIDAGSGIRNLGGALLKESAGKPIELTLLNTHTHWDHIQGFPFFAPAFIKGNRIRVIGRNSQPDGLKGVFERQMDGTRCFPVPFSALGADVEFETIDEESGRIFQIGSVKVEACPTNHPGGCLAYGFATDLGKVVFLSDHETGGPDEPLILEFIRDATLLIADAQYTDEEIVSRRGWGHGCIREVVDLACRAGVKQLCLFHHDPTHGDDTLDALLLEAKDLIAKANLPMGVSLAREGETILLS